MIHIKDPQIRRNRASQRDTRYLLRQSWFTHPRWRCLLTYDRPVLVRGPSPQLCRRCTGYSCEQCQADLAAFIDFERDSPARAATTYPHVWRHLCVCSACSQTYRCTQTLLAAERSGQLVPIRLLMRTAQRPAAAIRRVRLNQQMLALAEPRTRCVKRKT